MEFKRPKKGSSRRKGDEYQDLTAMRLALEMYIQKQEYQLFMEYEKAGSLDDIVIKRGSQTDAYQVKYAIHPNDLYSIENFSEHKSRVYFKKFADSWIFLRKDITSENLKLHLLTNRALDEDLSKIITDNGTFTQKFIEGKVYKRPREIHKMLQQTTQLNENDFKEFLKCFRFQVKQPSLDDLRQFIQGNLLDHQLGISDRAIFHIIKEIIEDYAISKHDALTPKLLDEVIKKTQSDYLLPQKFEVDRELFIEREELNCRLDEALQKIDGDYVVVTGLPGIGKSTSLTVYFDDREKNRGNTVVRYYCFVDINDNFQRRRLESQSLRVNLLSIMQNKFSKVLKRRFDYSEKNFYEALKLLGDSFHEKGRKLIIFLDGLDHAERMEEQIQETLLKSLPKTIPKGIVIVVGTQELHCWPIFLKRSRENLENHIRCPYFTMQQTEEYLVNKIRLKTLDAKHIREIHKKSEGLPIYLRYIAEKIVKSDDFTNEMVNFPSIPEGNIKHYYELLWQEFEKKGKVRHLCGVLACLRFPVHKDELFDFQEEVSRPDFADCFNLVKHLLKMRENLVEIFHNSFREFVLSELDKDWLHDINVSITNHLKSQEWSDLWFSYVFEYAYLAKDYNYIIETINRKFVDLALARYRPDRDIYNAINWAVEAAKDEPDLVALSRLGALKYRTKDRMEDHLDREILFKTLIALGRWKDVVRYSYSLHHNQWLIDFSTALSLLPELAEQRKREIGAKLFEIFISSFEDSKFEDRSDLFNYAYCLGIYSKSLAQPMRWLSKTKIKPDLSEIIPPYWPGYAPHLENFLIAVVRHYPVECWQKIKKVEKLFPNQLIRYLLIRSIAFYENKNILKREIKEYIDLFKPKSNPELAYFAAFSGLETGIVTKLLKDFPSPTISAPEPIHHHDTILQQYRKVFFALGYENNKNSIYHIKILLESKKSWWTSYLLYLLLAGQCVGRHWAGTTEDWFTRAKEAIGILVRIKQGEKERVIELLDLCRAEMVISLFRLTESVTERSPNRLKEWFNEIKSLQDSKIWTIHYGVMESIRDFRFELNVYEKLSSIPECRVYIFDLLKLCESKVKDSTNVKGRDRCSHFLKLAFIAAICGCKEKSEEWLQYGVRSTLIYGYRKDTTLFQLIDVMEMLNKHEPAEAMNRCADILEMIDWMPHLTDGKETRHLPSTIFEQVARISKNAAIRLLTIFSRNKARWQMQNCLETLIKNIKDFSGISSELLWSLTSIFANYSTDGEYAKQVINAKQHIVEVLAQDGNQDLYEKFMKRLGHFIQTNITPRHWTKASTELWQPPYSIPGEEDSQKNQSKSNGKESKSYKLNGRTLSLEEIKDILSASFMEYKDNREKLLQENEHFYEPDLIEPILKLHISKASKSDLILIKEYLCDGELLGYADIIRELGKRFLSFSDISNGLECFEMAYSQTYDWSQWEKKQEDIRTISSFDKSKALKIVMKESYNSLKEYDGYNVPTLIASSFDVWKDSQKLKAVYGEYLHHCRELFDHLPKTETYKWLKEYTPEEDNFNELAVNFLIDQLDTIEIDLGNRLIDACRLLCLEVPEIAFPVIFKRLTKDNFIVKSRLITILYLVVIENPSLVKSSIENIFNIFNSNHFLWGMMSIKILQQLEKKGYITETVERKLSSEIRKYSSVISGSHSQIFHIKPSVTFLDFFKGSVVKTYKQQIDACCEILSIETSYILAKIENCFRKEGWMEDDEKERIQDEWDDYLHPQGFPGILISTTFNSKVFYFFNLILNEIVKGTKITVDQFDALWQVLQPVDPEFQLSEIKPKPEDIEYLHVTDKNKWLAQLDKTRDKIARVNINREWISIFEKEILSQDKVYEVPYRSYKLLYSGLVKKEYSFDFKELWEKVYYVLEFKKLNINASITLAQAREALKYQPVNDPPSGYKSIPILTWETNRILFRGYQDVVTVPYYLMNKYGLHFRGFDLYDSDECMIRYQVWQEGYEDEAYSRELLSYGTRLQINKKLLEKISHDFHVELCQCIFEKRTYSGRKYDKNGGEENSCDTIVLIHNEEENITS
jgi:hypothetical protein